MISNLRPYPAYKDSGVPWLGQVPAHWEVRRLKYLLRERDARSETGTEHLLSVSQYAGVTERKPSDNLEEPDTRAESLVGYKRVDPDELVVNIMLAWNGSMGVSRYAGIVSPAYCVYRFEALAEPWYFHHLLRSPVYKARIKAVSTGVVESRLRLYTDNLYRLIALLPPLPEQTAIVRFLDYMDRRMRRYIRAKQKLIKLLEEYKQVLIHQAVTGKIDVRLPAPRPAAGMFCVYVLKCSDGSFYIGQTDNFPRRLREHCAGEVSWTASRLPVDPIHWEVFESREQAVKREHELKTGYGRQWLKREYAVGRLAAASRQAGTGKPYPAYKPSGVEWLGEVPAHWEVRRLGSVTQILNGATPSSSLPEYWDGDIVWVTPDDLGKLKGRYIDDSSRRITLEGYNACGTTLAPAGSIVVSTRAPIGHLGILRVAACANQGCRLLVPQAATASEYLYHVLVAARPSLEVLGQGSTFLELSRSKLGSFYIPLPPLPEQTAIVEYLDAQTAKLDAAIAAARREIELLREYRERLIADVVTGKLDVREVAARLPEESEEPDLPEEEGDSVTDESEEANGTMSADEETED